MQWFRVGYHGICHASLVLEYYPLDTAKYATAFQASDWLYFVRHGIKYNTIQCNTIKHNTIL